MSNLLTASTHWRLCESNYWPHNEMTFSPYSHTHCLLSLSLSLSVNFSLVVLDICCHTYSTFTFTSLLHTLLCRWHKTVKISSKAAACRGNRGKLPFGHWTSTSSSSLSRPQTLCPGRHRRRWRCHCRCYHYRIRHPATALQARTKVATFFIETFKLIKF